MFFCFLQRRFGHFSLVHFLNSNILNVLNHVGCVIVQANPWRGAGVAAPVFSLRSEESVGAGEFLDLRLLVDLAAKTGMRLVQLLPVNDTSVNMMWWDSYPYRYKRVLQKQFDCHVICYAASQEQWEIGSVLPTNF